jgi:hypothetical protein
MYLRREPDASPKLFATPLELARSVQAPIAMMMRLNNARRKGHAACFSSMLQRKKDE